MGSKHTRINQPEHTDCLHTEAEEGGNWCNNCCKATPAAAVAHTFQNLFSPSECPTLKENYGCLNYTVFPLPISISLNLSKDMAQHWEMRQFI